jgi:hypothetical protein
MGRQRRRASSPGMFVPVRRRPEMNESFLRPHPEEHRVAMRLEGWQRVRTVHPSFETRACGVLLRMRLKMKRLFLGVA